MRFATAPPPPRIHESVPDAIGNVPRTRAVAIPIRGSVAHRTIAVGRDVSFPRAHPKRAPK